MTAIFDAQPQPRAGGDMTFRELFALNPAGEGRWTAPAAPATDEARLFGGLLLGHALHALFLGVGWKEQPFDLASERIRDGRSFRTRRVDVRQRDRLLLTASTSHHAGDDTGPEHQAAMPDVPGPEALPDQREVRADRSRQRGEPVRRFLNETLMDVRAVDLGPDRANGLEGRRAVWFRPRRPIGDDPGLHQAAMAFASDMGLVNTGTQPHVVGGDRGRLQAASLDHAMWFHRDADADGWMLHVQASPVGGAGRGFSRASVFTSDGRLVASVAQEFLLRRRAE